MPHEVLVGASNLTTLQVTVNTTQKIEQPPLCSEWEVLELIIGAALFGQIHSGLSYTLGLFHWKDKLITYLAK